jgi:hypothetical protein
MAAAWLQQLRHCHRQHLRLISLQQNIKPWSVLSAAVWSAIIVRAFAAIRGRQHEIEHSQKHCGYPKYHAVQRAQSNHSAHPKHLRTPYDLCNQQRIFAVQH